MSGNGTTNGIGKSERVRCAIYTRKSTEEGLEQEFNTLDAQREAGEAYVLSQKSQGWEVLPEHYDDGGFSGGTMDRPAITRLLADIDAGKVDAVVVYKVDRLSRSLLDFARIMETFEKKRVAFVSVTQPIQHRHIDGAPGAERPPVVRPVRARDDRRAHARQDVGGTQEGEMGRRQASARYDVDSRGGGPPRRGRCETAPSGTRAVCTGC